MADLSFCPPGAMLAEAQPQLERAQASARAVAPRSAAAMGFALRWLAEARVLRVGIPLVPEGDGERRPATLEAYGIGLIPPAPVTAVEYEHSGVYDVGPDRTRCLATRRIALVVDLASEWAVDTRELRGFMPAAGDAGGLLIWPLTYFDEKHEWALAPGAAIVPRWQARHELTKAGLPLPGHLRSVVRRRLLQLLHRVRTDGAQAGAVMAVRYQEMLPELIDKLGQPQAGHVIRESALDALWVVLGLFTALHCDNVAQDLDAATVPRVRHSDGTWAPLDPFHGEVRWGWRLAPSWTQQVRMPFHSSSARA